MITVEDLGFLLYSLVKERKTSEQIYTELCSRLGENSLSIPLNRKEKILSIIRKYKERRTDLEKHSREIMSEFPSTANPYAMFMQNMFDFKRG